MITAERGRGPGLSLPRHRTLDFLGRPLVMGVVNVTPDSFSDGGRYLDPERAVEHALLLIAAGADLLDLGAESTRPGGGVYGSGAQEVAAEEERDRLLPVLERLRPLTGLPISVDTRKGLVAREALAAGADIVNDVSGLADDALTEAVQSAGCPVVVMHSRGALRSMQRGIRFRDVVAEVRRELAARLAHATGAGIARSQVILDPGIGFGKTLAQNLTLLRSLSRFAELGQPLLVGASRKSFIGKLNEAPADERLPGSLAAVAWSASAGVSIVRVHDVAETRQFLTVWSAIARAEQGPS